MSFASFATAVDSSSTVGTFLPLLSMGLAVVSVVGLASLQSDRVSQRILIPDRLQDKRHSEYVYRWSHALEKAKIQVQLCGAGGTTDTQFAQDEELVNTTFLSTLEEVQELVETLVKGSNSSGVPVRVGRIGTDPRMKPNELYLWLYQGRSNIYHVPLRTFGILLASAMDNILSKSTFCFVADASAGVASRLVVDLIQASTDVSTVGFVLEPLWMVHFAVIAQQRLLGTSVLERILFGLCRLEALAQQQTTTTTTTNRSPQLQQHSTVVLTLPGQSTTSILLPLLQKVFPDDRHVFGYAGCCQTVDYANTRRTAYPRAKVPDTMQEALHFTHPVSYTTPLDRSLSQSATSLNSKPYLASIRQLPLHHADVVESWMSTVNAFLTLKEEDKSNDYLPYVFKLEYLVTEGPLTQGSDRYWTLLSLLQYMLGSRSRELPPEQVDAAVSWLQDYQPPASGGTSLSATDKKAIQNVVFQHKLILIENKTLLDTVQPRQHWTLKQGVKAGCSCCGPEDEDEEEEEDQWARKEEDQQITKTAQRLGYVDGKTSFAFDPTRFSNTSQRSSLAMQ